MDITLATRKTIHAARREKSKEDRRKSKAEEKRKPTERILARLEVNKKEEIIKSNGHCTDLVSENKIIPNEGTMSNTSRNSSLNFQKSLRINSFKIPENPLETG